VISIEVFIISIRLTCLLIYLLTLLPDMWPQNGQMLQYFG